MSSEFLSPILHLCLISHINYEYYNKVKMHEGTMKPINTEMIMSITLQYSWIMNTDFMQRDFISPPQK